MQISLTMFLSLDGVYQAPGERSEDCEDGFQLGGWQVPFVDSEMVAFLTSRIAEADGFLFGRKTFQIFEKYWPHVTDETNVIAKQFNSRPKYVASRRQLNVDWAGTEVLQGDVVDAVRQLKQQPRGELQMHGSGELASALLAHAFIDELCLLSHPVLLGSGKRLFGAGSLSASFDLIDSQTTSTGVIMARYLPKGELKTGDFGISEIEKRNDVSFADSLISISAESRHR